MSAKSSVDEPNTWKTWVSAHKKLAANCNTNRNSNPLSPSFPNTLLNTTASLERQFNHLREQYYFERFNLIERQLSEVRSGRSEEFVQPQKELDKVYRTRIEVADVLRKFRLQNIEHKYLSEEQAASQHFEVIQSIIYLVQIQSNPPVFLYLPAQSEKQMALDYIREELMERIRRLEEDRHNVEISWDNWGNDKRQSKVRGPGRKKAVTVTGPYVVYMLREEDIMEDWNIIRKALKRSSTAAGAGAIAATSATAGVSGLVGVPLTPQAMAGANG